MIRNTQKKLIFRKTLIDKTHKNKIHNSKLFTYDKYHTDSSCTIRTVELRNGEALIFNYKKKTLTGVPLF